MTTFLTALESELNVTLTENGAKAYKSTLNKCLDLFGQIGASRENLDRADRLFQLALQEDKETALRILFWARDIRGGQGERSVFRRLLTTLSRIDPELTKRLVPLVPSYGRWDDLFSALENSEAWEEVLSQVKTQFNCDMIALVGDESGSVSLLGKWLPSINASSKDSKRLGKKIATYLGLSEKNYRKALKALRERIRIVEQPMCAREWSAIDYAKLPSRAAFMYRKAFGKRDGDRYAEYLNAVEKGEEKINASTLFPSDIVHKFLYGKGESGKTLNLQWEALPNYMEGLNFNGLVVADVSGSMGMCGGLPMAASIGLAMYIAERNTCETWKGKFLTFSGSPSLETVVGTSLEQRIRNLEKAHWSMNTDLRALFETVLNAATTNKVAPEDMPEKLIIVSDMQFDACCRSNKRTNFEQIQKLYRKACYEMPQLVFWNVNGSDNTPIKADDSGACLVSGYSPSILRTLLSGKDLSPIGVMMDTVYSERYQPVGEVVI
jgi:hypothetical protein